MLGVNNIHSAIPGEFDLYQNYPNPFNPATTISFVIPSEVAARRVSLAVFDILGREVSVLISGDLKPGNYKVNFDGSKYSSGVYFYKLTADEYTETKKMLMIK